ncbi:MAG TPA: redoxin domain-containing protein [Thermotogota bacterium]|nr:redoxin domain-containing protein [Thermotogota bacterium]HRW33831.1 redoxin domain-containing protein [Thermotogota bacterium]
MREEIIKIDEPFEEINLTDQYGELVDTQKYKGKKLLLSFHPLAWTPVCADQMKVLDELYLEFEALDIIPFGVSVDSSQSKKAWAEHLGIQNLQLLSDFWPHGELAKKLGVFMEDKGFSKRVNIVLDENRKVIWTKIYPIKEVPDFEEILMNFK